MASEFGSEFNREHAIETYKSLIQISLEAMKFLAYMNGGAVIALLAYLGKIAGGKVAVPDMRWPMACFLIGIVCSGFNYILAYLTQLRLFNETLDRGMRIKHTFFLVFAIIFACVSIIVFAVGSLWAVVKFR
jgi:hypothetical protein